MAAAFEDYLKAHTGIDDDSIEKIISFAKPKLLRRNEYLFRAGEICQHKVFINSGLLRTFNITADGNEHIVQFSPENNWTVDAESYDRQTPSLVNISAIENSELLLWRKADFVELINAMPELKQLSEQIISKNMHFSRRRMLSALGSTPEEKYKDFIDNSPELLSRLPLRMVASYLGISLKTLNRVRNSILYQSENSVK
jgi:CRP-like cAMP-binding protein